jgi:hypothetical protein
VINEILCASVLCLVACASAPQVHREADLNASVQRIQVHEAAIERCHCSPEVCEHALQICDEASLFSDADLQARCHQASHACEAQSSQRNEECACD